MLTIACAFLFLEVAFAINLPAQQSIRQSFLVSATQYRSPLPTPTVANSIAFNASSAVDGQINATNPRGQIYCKSQGWGSDLSRASCQAALDSIPLDPTLQTFGWRSVGEFQVPLPRRFLSRKHDLSLLFLGLRY